MNEQEKLNKRESELNTELRIIKLKRIQTEQLQKSKNFAQKASETAEQIKSLEDSLPEYPTSVTSPKKITTKKTSSKKTLDSEGE